MALCSAHWTHQTCAHFGLFGHFSHNLPFDLLLRDMGKQIYASPEELRKVFNENGVDVTNDDEEVILTCGSGGKFFL